MSTVEMVDSTSPFTDPDGREQLRELPPSAKLIAKVLEDGKPASQGQLAEDSLLPDRTVRYALNRLQDKGLVDTRYSFRDARKQLYYLSQ